jgi:hypothetical protein
VDPGHYEQVLKYNSYLNISYITAFIHRGYDWIVMNLGKLRFILAPLSGNFAVKITSHIYKNIIHTICDSLPHTAEKTWTDLMPEEKGRECERKNEEKEKR